MNDLPTTDQEWRKRLSSEQYEILRRKGTEPPFSGKYVHEKADGMYHCAACGAALFASDAKFESSTGWPSFTEPVTLKSLELRPDDSHGMTRTEVVCRRCGSHLGHVFDDDGGKQYCINSAALNLKRR